MDINKYINKKLLEQVTNKYNKEFEEEMKWRKVICEQERAKSIKLLELRMLRARQLGR